MILLGREKRAKVAKSVLLATGKFGITPQLGPLTHVLHSADLLVQDARHYASAARISTAASDPMLMLNSPGTYIT